MNLFIFDNLPQGLISLVAPFMLIAIGFLVERNFVGRIATFTNTLAINIAYYGKDLSTLGIFEMPLIIYLDIGLIWGIIALVAYSGRNKRHGRLPSLFYKISWIYCSIVAGILTLLSLWVAYSVII